jgi:hypothetical protein
MNQINQTNQMTFLNLFFAFLSVVYIFVIFYFAGSPAISLISPYNYCSLLHIPLYGVLTVLLILSLLPPKLFRPARINQINQINLIWVRLFLAGLISFVVGIADEYHQVFVPGREGDFGDVLLDLAGIILAVLLILRILRRQRAIYLAASHRQIRG